MRYNKIKIGGNYERRSKKSSESFFTSNHSNNSFKTFGYSNKNNRINSNTFTCYIFPIQSFDKKRRYIYKVKK